MLSLQSVSYYACIIVVNTRIRLYASFFTYYFLKRESKSSSTNTGKTACWQATHDTSLYYTSIITGIEVFRQRDCSFLSCRHKYLCMIPATNSSTAAVHNNECFPRNKMQQLQQLQHHTCCVYCLLLCAANTAMWFSVYTPPLWPRLIWWMRGDNTNIHDENAGHRWDEVHHPAGSTYAAAVLD